MRLTKHTLLRVFKGLIVAYILICLFMWGFQRSLMYMPVKTIQPPETYGLADFTDVALTSSDGVKIHDWYHKAAAAYPTIVYLHGNGGNMGSRAHYYRLLADKGFGVLALDYRGYGASEGDPSEQGFYRDARATLDYARQTLSLPDNQIIIYGESIGTGVAVQMATEYKTEALVLQSPFTSLEAIASASYPWLPVHFLIKDTFDSLSKIKNVHMPLLVFHGEKDGIVPVAMGKALFEQANAPKKIMYYSESGHTNLDITLLAQALTDFCAHYHLTPSVPASAY